MPTATTGEGQSCRICNRFLPPGQPRLLQRNRVAKMYSKQFKHLLPTENEFYELMIYMLDMSEPCLSLLWKMYRAVSNWILTPTQNPVTLFTASYTVKTDTGQRTAATCESTKYFHQYYWRLLQQCLLCSYMVTPSPQERDRPTCLWDWERQR